MNVEIVEFPETRVAAIEHLGPPQAEYKSVMKLIQWRKENNFPPSPAYRNYGLHYNDPRKVSPQEYRVDLCISVDRAIEENPYGVISKVIPHCRCARARHLGSRENVQAAEFLYAQWLPQSGEEHSGLPLIFHYVNVGPDIRERDMITDVYLPLK